MTASQIADAQTMAREWSQQNNFALPQTKTPPDQPNTPPIEVFTIIGCFYYYGPGDCVANYCSPDFYQSTFQSMEACEKERKENLMYHDSRIPPIPSAGTAGADIWKICVPKAEFERHLHRDKVGLFSCFAAQKEPDDPRKLDVKEICAGSPR